MRQQGSCYVRHQTESEAAPYQDGACIEAVLTWPSVSHVICGATLFFFFCYGNVCLGLSVGIKTCNQAEAICKWNVGGGNTVMAIFLCVVE